MTNNDKLKNPVLTTKGHLTLKSSALATEPCKLDKQYMIARNLASHYKRVLSAKSTIDCKPPRSIIQSQKARDRLKRETQNKSSLINRPRSADSRQREQLIDSDKLNSFRNTSARSNIQTSSSYDLNKNMLETMKKMTINHPTRVPLKSYTTQNTSRSDDDNNAKSMNQTMFKTQNMNNSFSNSNTENLMKNAINELLNPSLKAMSRLVAGKNYDVLDNHAKFFKQPEQEFVPRINKRKAESKLKQTGVYNPPRQRSRSSARTPKDHTQSMSAFEDNYEPMESARTTARTNTALTDRSNTILDQSIASQSNFNSSKAQIIEDDEKNKKKEINIKKMSEKEEELKYLNFIKEVTDDIIARGVCTNRVINNVFEYHISRNKNTLNAIKMRELLDTLRKDIGIPTENENIIDTDYSPSILKASRFDQETQISIKQNQINNNDKYSILERFDWSADVIDKAPLSSMNRTFSPSLSNKDNKKIINKNNSNNNFSSEMKKQHNNITQNIDSIRKTNRSQSIASTVDDKKVVNNNNNNNNNNSRKSSAESITIDSPKKGSFNNKNSNNNNNSRKSSAESITIESPKKGSFHNKNNNNSNNSRKSSAESITIDSPKKGFNDIIKSSIESNDVESPRKSVEYVNIFTQNKTFDETMTSYNKDEENDDKKIHNNKIDDVFHTNSPKNLSRINSNDSDDQDRDEINKNFMSTLKVKKIESDEESEADDQDEVDKQFLTTLKNKPVKFDSEDENEDIEDNKNKKNNLMTTLKKTPIVYEKDDDEDKIPKTKTSNKIIKNKNIDDEDIDFNYDFGEKELSDNDDNKTDDEEFNRKLTETIGTKRFQNKNFNRTLKFTDTYSDDEDNEPITTKPKPAPRKFQTDLNASKSDSDSF